MSSSEPSGHPHIKKKSGRRYCSVKDWYRSHKGESGLSPCDESRVTPRVYEDEDKVKASLDMNVLEYVLFTLLILVNFCWGLYFSIYERRKSTGSDATAQEFFLEAEDSE
ncbi:hypothetical protein MRX96_059846 [Rhipicephalus microplus]